MNSPVPLGAIATVASLTVALSWATARSAKASGLPESQAKAIASRVALSIGLWLALMAGLAVAGVFQAFEAKPPRLVLAVTVTVIAQVIVARSALFSRLLNATPLAWPIALQSMRVVIELGLWTLHREGRLPVHLTFEGNNFDILVGLTAPFVGWGVARGVIGKRGAIVWNLASIGFLITIVFMAVTSIPGPLHLPWPGIANTVIAEFPMIWLPTFVVPVAIFGHAASLRQLLRATPNIDVPKASTGASHYA
jgi:hypothetical protein